MEIKNKYNKGELIVKYNEFKNDKVSLEENIYGTIQIFNIIEEYLKQAPPKDLEETIEVIEVLKEMFAEYLKNYGLAEKSLEECKKIAQKNKEYLIKKFNAPETLKLPGLGIE